MRSKSCCAARGFWRYSRERTAGRESFADGYCGGLFWGVIVSEKPSSLSSWWGCRLILPPPKERGSRRLVELQILIQESPGSSFPHAQSLPPYLASFQVVSLCWELELYDACWNPFVSLPPFARLGLGYTIVPEKLQRLFLTLEFVLD